MEFGPCLLKEVLYVIIIVIVSICLQTEVLTLVLGLSENIIINGYSIIKRPLIRLEDTLFNSGQLRFFYYVIFIWVFRMYVWRLGDVGGTKHHHKNRHISINMRFV